MTEPAVQPLPAAAFRVHRPIRFSHCDPAGIVYFPNFFDLFNALVEDWFTHGLGIDYAHTILKRRLGLPTVHAECDFMRPCWMGEMLTLGVVVEHIGRSSLKLRIVGEIDGKVRLAGRLVLVTMSLESHTSVPIPDDLRTTIERYRATCD